MTGPEHYAQAGRLIEASWAALGASQEEAQRYDRTGDQEARRFSEELSARALVLATQAQAHATLAHAAAVAESIPDGVLTSGGAAAWAAVIAS